MMACGGSREAELALRKPVSPESMLTEASGWRSWEWPISPGAARGEHDCLEIRGSKQTWGLGEGNLASLTGKAPGNSFCPRKHACVFYVS